MRRALWFTLLIAFVLSAYACSKPAAINLVKIPAGSFTMGCLADDDCLWMEHPAHSVNIAAFYLAETETTWAQYQPCVDAGACQTPPASNDARLPDLPVTFVNQNDVNTFIEWLNTHTGKRYRLPSEAEWEYAARAGSVSRYSWGHTASCDKARYSSSADSGCPLAPNGTARVASYQANAFGLHDMHGNVRELVADCWNNSYTQAPINGDAWMEGKCYKVVLRGGAWSLDSKHLRAAYRHRGLALARENLSGFRLALNL